MSKSRVEALEAQVQSLLAEVKALTARVGVLETENSRLRAENRKLRRNYRRVRDENQRLRGEVRSLKGQATEAEASSECPDPEEAADEDDSSAVEQAPNEPAREAGRRRGGQPNHKPAQRELAPPSRVDETVPLLPRACRGCGAKLRGKDPQPLRHQVWEIPKPKATVTEYQLHGLCCSECGVMTRAELPEGVPSGAFGPRLQAVVAVCTGFYRLSKRTTQELLSDFFEIPMSLGALSKYERVVSEALARPVQEAHEYVQQQAVCYVDETGWRERLAKSYLWTMVTTYVTVFMIGAGRNKDLALKLLGAFKGALVTDRLKTYEFWPIHRHQFCWAHLKRRFEDFLLEGPAARRVGAGLLVEVRLLFDLWYRVRDGTLSRSSFRNYVTPIRRRVRALLEEGTACAHAETEATCRELLRLEPALWTFVRVEGVEPTNNAAERSLRHGVLWRRVSFGTDSERGSQFVERILATVASLRQQNRNVLEFVTQACRAQLLGEAPPSLLPSQELLEKAAAA